jgi:hypothetical protein
MGHTVVKEWALSWSRRILIKTAIRMIAPRTAQSFNRMRDQTIGPRQTMNRRRARRSMLSLNLHRLTGSPL